MKTIIVPRRLLMGMTRQAFEARRSCLHQGSVIVDLKNGSVSGSWSALESLPQAYLLQIRETLSIASSTLSTSAGCLFHNNPFMSLVLSF